MDDKARVWFARVLAPLAFLAAATLLVILVQRALDTDDSAGSTQPSPTVTVSTQVEETGPGTTAAGEPEQQFYRIRTGDTLEAIAQRFDTTVVELEELNPGIDPLALTVGDRIRVS
jgi:spore germination protein YaaH